MTRIYLYYWHRLVLNYPCTSPVRLTLRLLSYNLIVRPRSDCIFICLQYVSASRTEDIQPI